MKTLKILSAVALAAAFFLAPNASPANAYDLQHARAQKDLTPALQQSLQDKLSDVAPRERRSMKVFGYNQPDEAKPFLRLACQAKALGNATIVIPPWNGVFGKKVRGNVEELELEPATTSARALRDTIASAASGE